MLIRLPPGGKLSTKLTDEGQFHSKNKNKFTHGLNHAGANQLRAQLKSEQYKECEYFPTGVYK